MSLVAPVQESRLAVWRMVENRSDRWTSFGALALGATVTAVMMLF